MAMTIGDIEKRVRAVLMDDVPPDYRWSEAFILSAIEDGIAFLHSIRPETRYMDGILTDGVKVPQDTKDEEFPVHSRYREAVVAYVAYKCLERDSSDTQNLALAETFLNKAKTLMQV